MITDQFRFKIIVPISAHSRGGHAVRGVGFGSGDHGFGPCLSLWFNQIYCLFLRFIKTCERIFLSYEKRKLNKLKKSTQNGVASTFVLNC